LPFDLVAFGEATPGAADPAAIAVALGDTLYSVSGDDLRIKKQAPWLLGYGAFAEAQGARSVLSQPTPPLNYEFLKCALLAAQSPSLCWNHMFGRPLPLVPEEKLNVGIEMIADEDAIAFLLLGSGKITQAMLDAVNPTHRITGEADTTVTAFKWTDCPVTWDQSLPRGRYAPVGMIFSYWKTAAPAMPAAARLVFHEEKASGWRPGVVGCYLDKDHEELQTMDYFPAIDWPLMSNIDFSHDNVPSIEVCAAEAHTDQNFELLLQKVG